jgi:hypothetical protein
MDIGKVVREIEVLPDIEVEPMPSPASEPEPEPEPVQRPA